ncbi:MAG: hypothetical protein WCJ61_04260 [Paludibacter sp.]
MKFKSTAIIALGLIMSTVAFSQEEKVDTLNVHEQRITSLEDATLQSKKLKFSGYIQSEWQSSQIDINGNASQDMKVGAGANAAEKADAITTPGSTFNRFGVRRGRLKATYTDNGCIGVVYIDATEKGVVLKEAYAAALDPWIGYLTLKGGIFNKPFGYEIEYSSSSRETPERSRVIQTLFPNERDLGGMITLQAPKGTPWNVLKLDLGLLSGNAIGLDSKSKKDIVAHLSYSNSTPTFKYGIGASMYNGYVLQPSRNVYSIVDNVFKVDSTSTNKNGFANKQYYGLDGQFSIATVAGLTTIRGEYLFGTQPGSASSTKSNDFSISPSSNPSSATTSVLGTDGKTITSTTTTTLGSATPAITGDAFLRKFTGGYIQLSQDIADTKHTISVKYDFYDPNAGISKDNIGAALTTDQVTENAAAKTAKRPTTYVATNKADIAYSTIGFGYMYRMNNNVKFMVYYDMPLNETSAALATAGSDFTKALAANLLTVRLQYKF